MKTVTLQFIPNAGTTLTYRGGVKCNLKAGEPMVRVAKYHGYRKTVSVFANGLTNLMMVKADDKIVWLA